MALKYVQTLTLYQAGAGNIIGATSVVLTTLTDIYGNAITSMTPFGTKGYITLEPDTTNEEGATFTGVTPNANGTTTLTGISTILAQSPYTETSGLVRNHAGGSKVVVTDNVAFWNTFANINNDQTFTGANTFTQKVAVGAVTSSDLGKAATVDFVNATAVAGAPNASSTVKGIVQEATQAQVLAKTAAGSTGAELYVNPLTLASTLLSDYKVDTGAANAYVITPAPAITAYTTGQIFSFKAVNANTTASTINVNGLGVKTIKNPKGGDLVANDIGAGQLVMVGYDGTNMIMLSPSGNAVGFTSTGLYPAADGSNITNIGATTLLQNFLANETITSGTPVSIGLLQGTNIGIDTKAIGSLSNGATQALTISSLNANRMLIVLIGQTTNVSAFTSSATYNGVALNWTSFDSGGVVHQGAAVGWLANPPSGTNNLVISAGTGGGGSISGSYAAYVAYNCNQSGVDGNALTAAGAGTPTSLTYTSLNDGVVVFGLAVTANASQTPGGNVFTEQTQTTGSNPKGASGESGVANLYPNGTVYTLTGTPGGSFALIGIRPFADPTQGVVEASSASANNRSTGFIGFAKNGGTVGQTISVVMQGVATGLTNLQTATQYYLNDSNGTFGAAAGSVTRKIGIALSKTSLLITNIW